MSLKNKFCPKPFEYLDIHYVDGEFRCYVCCPTWLPVNIGDIEKEGFEAIWNGPKLREIRKSMQESSFLYCNKELCPEIQSGKLHDKDYIYKTEYKDYLAIEDGKVSHGPRIVYFSEDRTCNLACPSCRKDYISISEEESKRIAGVREEFIPLLLKDAESLNICSSGDPFASKIYRDFLFSFEGAKFPRLEINLNTNGVLLTESVFNKMANVHGNLGSIYISLDAARPETYAITRKGGDWQKALSNIRFLAAMRKKGAFKHLQLDFVVQDYNYRELPEFVKLGQELGVDKVYFQRISNWGTYSKVEYEERNIMNPTHKLYPHFKDICQHPLMASSIIKSGNISRYFPKSNRDKFTDFLKSFPLLRKVRKAILSVTH